MDISSYYIKTNEEITINHFADLTSIHSVEIVNTLTSNLINNNNYSINDLDELIINIDGNDICSINFKSILKDINKITIEDNKINFSKYLFFQNDEYIHNYLFRYSNIKIIIKSNKCVTCKLNVIKKYIDNDAKLNILELQKFNLNKYKYKKINGDTKINNLILADIKLMYIKGSKISKIKYDVKKNLCFLCNPVNPENVDFNLIKKIPIFNNKSIRIIKTVKSLKLINDVQNKILEYCDIYEFLYKICLDFDPDPNKFLTFDREFYGEILIIRDDQLLVLSGIGLMY